MASPQEPGRPWIDTTEFTRTGQRLEGHSPIAGFERMSDMLADDDGLLDWTLQGERSRRSDGGFDAHLALGFSARVRMHCVRCLEPVEVLIEDRRHFKLVVAESVAEREDMQTEEFDLLVSSPRLDVLELLEDEAIMALPLAPRHDECSPPPEHGTVDSAGTQGILRAEPAAPAEPARPNPFAVLAGLKTRRSEGDGEN